MFRRRGMHDAWMYSRVIGGVRKLFTESGSKRFSLVMRASRVYRFACRAISRRCLKIMPSDVWWAELTFRSQFQAGESDSDLERPGRNVLEKKNEEWVSRMEKKNGQERDRIALERFGRVYERYHSLVYVTVLLPPVASILILPGVNKHQR